MVLGHRQDIMVADHREIWKTENSTHIRRPEHLPQRLLDSRLDLGDLSPQGRKPATRGIQHLAAGIEATLDGQREAGKLSDARTQAAKPRKLVVDPGNPPLDVADCAGSRRFQPGPRARVSRPPRLDARDGEYRATHPTGASSPTQSASTISDVSARRWWISPGTMLGSIRSAAILPSEQAARAATKARILANSRISSVCVSMVPHDRRTAQCDLTEDRRQTPFLTDTKPALAVHTAMTSLSPRRSPPDHGVAGMGPSGSTTGRYAAPRARWSQYPSGTGTATGLRSRSRDRVALVVAGCRARKGGLELAAPGRLFGAEVLAGNLA